MKLVSVEKVRNGLSARDIADVNNLIGTAIDQATAIISSVLGTSFDRTTYQDLFQLDTDSFQFSIKNLKLALSAGFVTDDEPLVVKFATTQALLATATAYDGFYSVRKEGGVLIFPDNLLGTGYALVDYTAGFEFDEETEAYAAVPTWLQAAAVALSYEIYGVLKDDDLKKDAKAKKEISRIQPMSDAVYSILEPHVRFFPSAIQAI